MSAGSGPSPAPLSATGRPWSPTLALLAGLALTLVAIVADAWYVTTQITALRALQTDIADRHRRNSLQLLRIQDDLHSIGLAMRDMLDSEEPYPLTAWSAQFERIRSDLDAALQREADASAASRSSEEREYLTRSLGQFWDAVDRVFALAADGQDAQARDQIRLSLQARQASLSTAVARLLVQNNVAEDDTAQRVQAIYTRVQRQVYWFVGATAAAILITSLLLIRANRRVFAQLGALSDERRELAQQLISTREATLRDVSRELHDDFGQVLTAVGSMLARLGRQVPAGSSLQTDLHEIQEVAQSTLDKVRELSQTLHPSMLEDAGLDSTIEWHLAAIERQTQLRVVYERHGDGRAIDSARSIHVYRVLQEAMANIVRHAGTASAWVRLRYEPAQLVLEVEDHGRGLRGQNARRGLGLVGMRERAALVGGVVEFLTPSEGGTLVRFTMPLTAPVSGALTVGEVPSVA